ncbi:MAG: hypothetical protein ACXAC2_07410, partial [Candidatus Kariarchaeaceae archaeon]
EYLYWIGPKMGVTSAALGILVNSWKGDKDKALRLFGKPKLYTEFLGFKASSSIDSSDGIAKSLFHLSNMSDVGFEMNRIDVDEWVNTIVNSNDLDVIELLFYGGEEMGIIFTSPNMYQNDSDLILLGKVTSTKLVKYDGELIKNIGWSHFDK